MRLLGKGAQTLPEVVGILAWNLLFDFVVRALPRRDGASQQVLAIGCEF